MPQPLTEDLSNSSAALLLKFIFPHMNFCQPIVAPSTIKSTMSMSACMSLQTLSCPWCMQLNCQGGCCAMIFSLRHLHNLEEILRGVDFLSPNFFLKRRVTQEHMAPAGVPKEETGDVSRVTWADLVTHISSPACSQAGLRTQHCLC